MTMLTAKEAIEKLKKGNDIYVSNDQSFTDISHARRNDVLENGQHPYAVVVSCSDSRVIPEEIFSAGIGDLFVIRVAGNVIDDHQLGSIEYATEHLGCKLVLVLGHNHCGAVDAAINHDPQGYIKFITDEIVKAIKDEKEDYAACCMNVDYCVEMIEKSFIIEEEEQHGLVVTGAIYQLEDGKVNFDYRSKIKLR